MVMASAGVNMPGPSGDGNPTAASSSTPEWRLRRRRRLAPPRVATETAGPDEDAAAAASPNGEKRSRPASPSSSSSSEYSLDSVDEEEGELPPVGLALPAPAPAPAPAQVWPVAFGSMELAGRMREMEDTVSLHPAFYTWLDGSPMHFFAVFDGHGGTHVSALCRDQMHLILADQLAAEAEAFLHRRQLRRQQAAAGVGTSAAAAAWAEQEEEYAWRAALSRAFHRVDELAAVACACGRATSPRCGCRLSGQTSGIVGSTAVVTVLIRGCLVVANCGDSRAVLCRGPGGSPPVPLSSDHKETGS